MPPKQKNSTPIKPPEGSTMTHESEDIQYEISKLEKRLDELEGLMIKKEDLVNSQRNIEGNVGKMMKKWKIHRGPWKIEWKIHRGTWKIEWKER